MNLVKTEPHFVLNLSIDSSSQTIQPIMRSMQTEEAMHRGVHELNIFAIISNRKSNTTAWLFILVSFLSACGLTEFRSTSRPSKSLPPEVVQQPNGADASAKNPDDSITNPDGSITNPDGSITNPDGSITNPDGSITNPDGSITNPDGSITNPDDGGTGGGTTGGTDGGTTGGTGGGTAGGKGSSTDGNTTGGTGSSTDGNTTGGTGGGTDGNTTGGTGGGTTDGTGGGTTGGTGGGTTGGTGGGTTGGDTTGGTGGGTVPPLVSVCSSQAACLNFNGKKLVFWNDRTKIDSTGKIVPDNFLLGNVENLATTSNGALLELVSDVRRKAKVKIERGSDGNPIVSMSPGFRANMCYDHSKPTCSVISNDTNCSSHIRYVFDGISKTLGESTCRRCLIRGGIGNHLADFSAESAQHCENECQRFSVSNPSRSCRHLQTYATKIIKERPIGICRISGDSGAGIYEGWQVSQGQCYWSCKGKKSEEEFGVAIINEEFPNRFIYNGDITTERPNRRCSFNGIAFCEGLGETSGSCNQLNWHK